MASTRIRGKAADEATKTDRQRRAYMAGCLRDVIGIECRCLECMANREQILAEAIEAARKERDKSRGYHIADITRHIERLERDLAEYRRNVNKYRLSINP